MTISLPSSKLQEFPDLTAHVQQPQRKLKLTLGGRPNDEMDGSVSCPTSASPAAVPLTPTTTSGAVNMSKIAPIVRVGISGLTMNSQIVRELDVSKTRPGKWAMSGDATVVDKPDDVKKAEGEAVAPVVKRGVDVSELDEQRAITFKDVRGFKEHPEKQKQIEFLDVAVRSGRRVTQSFSGYVTVWPSWHRVESGNLVKRPEYSADRERGGLVKSGAAKKGSKGNVAGSEIPTRTGTPIEVKDENTAIVDGVSSSGTVSESVVTSVVPSVV